MHLDWKNRKLDFEKWKKPPENFGPSLPITIHLAGESREKELRDSLERDQQEWKSKLVVDNPTFQHHR